MRAINPDVLALIEAAAQGGARGLETLPPAEARKAYAASRRALQPPLDDVPHVEDVEISSGDARIGLRVIRGVASERPLPCLLFLHGGGWMVGGLDSHEGICRRLARHAGCVVVSVDYRLAPEHPFPAAVDDAVAALRWVAAHAGELAIDPALIAVGGDSAGGNLAAVLALMGRDGSVPASVFQLLLYPAVDLRMATATFDSAAAGMPITAGTIRWFVDHYAPDPRDRDDWRASPIRAASLGGTPPAFVLTCGHDPLCEEGRLYAARLESEGVAVTALHLSDQAHGALNLGKAVGGVTGILAFAAFALSEGWRHAGKETGAPAETPM